MQPNVKKVAKNMVIISTFLIVMFIIICIISQYVHISEIEKTNYKFKEKILLQNDVIELSELTPFEWDKVYFFDAYLEKDTIYEILGFKWNAIKRSLNDNENQVLFVKDNKVVCYSFGYKDEYYVYCDFEDGEFYKIFYLEDKPIFEIIQKDPHVAVVYQE